MIGRSPALPYFVLFVALGAASCRPAAEHAPPSLLPSGPLPPTPAQTLTTLATTDGRGAPPATGQDLPLTVTGFGPRGRTDGGGTIFVRFNQAVVSLAQTNQDLTDVGIVLDPKVEGRSYFQTPELLVFEPQRGSLPELPIAHRLTARLVGQVVALSGARLASAPQWDFETPRPRVSGWEVRDREDDEATRGSVVVLTLELPTTLEALQPLLTAKAVPTAKGQPRRAQPVTVRATVPTATELERMQISYAKEDQGRIFLITPSAPWPGQSEIELTVQKGLPTTRGPLTSDRPFSTKFPTLSPLRLLSSDCPPTAPCGLTPLTLRFNNRIREEQLKKLRIVPLPLDFQVSVTDGWGDGGRELNLTGVFVPGTTYRISLPADFSDRFGQKLGQATTVAAVIARRPTLELSQASGILRAGVPQTVGVLTRHVRTLQVRAAVLDDQTAVAFLTEHQRPWRDGKPPPPLPWPTTPLRQIERTYTLAPSGPSDWDEVTLDVAALSDKAQRAVLIEVQASELVAAAAGQPVPPPVRGLYRLTDLGPVGFGSLPQQVLAVMRLSSGQPVAGAQLALYQSGQTPVQLGHTDAAGVLVVPGTPTLGPLPHGQTGAMLVATSPQGDDHAYLTWPNYDNASTTKTKEPDYELRAGERAITHVVTERDAYLPGERVRVVGWAAIDTPYQRSGLRRPHPSTPVTIELQDSRHRFVATHQTTLTAEGKFWAELPIPEHGALGDHKVTARLLRTEARVWVKVEDFRVPEFNVAATVTRADVLPGEATAVVGTATYFFGGPMRIRRASYRQSCYSTSYTPPGLPAGWTVGAAHGYRSSDGGLQYLPAGGLGRLRFDMRPPDGITDDRRCSVSLALTDSSFQTLGAQTDYLAHAARYYLAIEQQKGTLTEGDTARVAVRALAVDGTRLAAPGVRMSVVWEHLEWTYKLVAGKRVPDRLETQRDAVHNCTLDLAATGPDLTCQFPVAQPGTYELVATGGDRPDTRHARSLTTLHVRARPTEPVAQAVASKPPATLELEVSSRFAKPGEQLKVTLRAPWPGASGVLALSRSGVREYRPFQLHGGAAEFTLPIDDTWFPQVSLEAFVVHVTARHAPSLARASSSVTLNQEHRQLQVTVTAPKEASPGTELPVTVQVRGADKKPVAAHLALWAVDDAVLSLTNYEVRSPLYRFVPAAESGTVLHDDYSSFLAPFMRRGGDPWFLRNYSSGGRSSMGSRRSSSPSVMADAATVKNPRNRFETTPLFLADVVAGPDGLARTTVHLPDNMTTFRITAVASARLVDGESPGRFGVSDARVRVSAPLIVRAALPRLMRPGDAAEIGALVNNLSGPRGRMQLTVRILEAGPPSLQLTSPARVEQPIEPGAQLRLPFSLVALRASKTPAVVEVQVTLTPEKRGAAVLQDAVQLPLPVAAEPTLRDRVATYGDLTSDAAVRIPVQIPEAVRSDSGGLTISASTSLLGGVAEAAAELVEYPYGCVEQTASRLLPLVALKDVLTTYPLPIPDGDVQRYLAAGVQRVLSMQTAAGGFAYWPGGREPNVYASAYATWVLHLASRSGYAVPAAELSRAVDYLQLLVEPSPAGAKADADSDEDADPQAPSAQLGYDYLDSARRALAVQVLAELGRPVSHALADLVRRRDELPLFARALVVMAVKAQKSPPADPRLSAQALSDELLGNVAELPGTARVNDQPTYRLESLFHSATRTDAMVLLALLRTQPNHPVVTKLARGLLERRGGAGWRNTQENAYAVLALAEYAHIYEHETPALTTRAWLPSVSPRPQWEAKFTGRSLVPQSIQLPMAQLLPGLLPAAGAGSGPGQGAASSGLVLQRLGQGRLYYRVGFEWTPAATELPARAQGLRVARSLRVARGAVTADLLLPPAEPVAIDVVIENRVLMNYVVADVPLPAGLEAVQQQLGRGHQSTNLPGERSPLLSHEESRRDRALLFFDVLPPGTHRHTVYVRTTTPGRYTLPPALAETMYTPELYGRSTSGRITVTADLPAELPPAP